MAACAQPHPFALRRAWVQARFRVQVKASGGSIECDEAGDGLHETDRAHFNIKGLGVGAMRKILCTFGMVAAGVVATSSMSLAGGPDTYAYAPDAPIYDWSGIYIGGHAGPAFNNGHGGLITSTTEPLTPGRTEFIGGGQIGVQKQFRDTVIGAEFSYSWLGPQLTSASVAQPGLSVTSDFNNLLLATGKIGLAYLDYLAYVKGGYATANVDYKTLGLFTSSTSGRGNGWVGGAGIDYALRPNIILGIEYNYITLVTDQRTQALSPFTTIIANTSYDIQTAMLRLDFKFGAPQP
jgi:outer membrane immunogenic protein